MRLAIPLFACMGVSAGAWALADPPAHPETSSAALSTPGVAAPAPAAVPPETTAAPTEHANAAATSAAPAGQSPAAPTRPTPTAVVEAARENGDEKRLRAAGYKPEMVNGEQIWCRKETALGSRLAAQKVCGTAKSLALSEQETQDRFTSSQKRQSNPTNH